MRKSAYPKLLRVGSVVVKIYRVRHKTTKSGFDFVVGWRDADGKPRRKHYADEDY